MGIEEIRARLRRAKAIINNISVAGKQNWQALLVATGDLEAVENALQEQKKEEPEPEESEE